MKTPPLPAFALLLCGTLAAAAPPPSTPAPAAATTAARPLLGAQVWIEPGQTPEEIDGWFRTLAASRMPVARLFLMWNHLEPAPGRWDYSLYDTAFAAAERHHVRVVATLTAHHGPPHRGYAYRSQGSRIVDTAERLVEAEDYVGRVVSRYAKSPALDTWMLMNEPGQAPSPDPLAVARFRDWLKARYGAVDRLNAAWLTAFSSFEAIAYDERWAEGGWTWPSAFVDWHAFWREHLRWHLEWVAQQIRRHDPAHPIHVNPHALVDNLSGTSTDLPSWMPFLDSLGASIHPGWHFGLLARDQFALGVAYACDLVRGAAAPKPFWVTELQGGNNLYSASRPLNPTPEDIAQWTWTAIGSGADRVVYWLLNARRQGGEAAEWSLLDFQQRPSERLREASAIARVVNAHADVFAAARPVSPRVSVILSLDTMTLQDNYKWNDLPGRRRQAHLLSALGAYQALVELGVPTSVELVHHYDWEGASAASRIVVLPHLTAVSAEQARRLETFVRNGNTLLVTGLTGLFDPQANAWPLGRSALEPVLGARLKEIRLVGESGLLKLEAPALELPFHLWQGEIEPLGAGEIEPLGAGEIEPLGAGVIGRDGARVVATRHRLGRGEAIWIPSLVALASWLGDREPFTKLLAGVTQPVRDELAATGVTFAERQPGTVLRAMNSGTRLVAIVTNGEATAKSVRLATTQKALPRVIYGDAGAVTGAAGSPSVALGAGSPSVALGAGSPSVALGARGTVVLLWE